MFGRSVCVAGRDFFVLCTPDTPLSEVLERAARQARREEDARSEAEQCPYREAIHQLAHQPD